MKRRGAILIVVIVCLAVAGAMFVLVVKQAVLERQAMQTGQWSLQAVWLTEAGVERAAARLAADPKYIGETWNIPAKELVGDSGAVVRIEVKTIADQSEQRSIRVEADYPDAPEHRCRQTKQVVMDLSVIKPRQQTETTN